MEGPVLAEGRGLFRFSPNSSFQRKLESHFPLLGTMKAKRFQLSLE